MKNFICVYDFETDGIDPNTCQPVQLAACMIHPLTLEIVDNSEFCTGMKPINIDEENYYTSVLPTIKWHAKNYDTTPEKIFETWKQNPDQKAAWTYFIEYLRKYNTDQNRKAKFTAPIRAGANIRNFDDIITNRLCKQYGFADKEGKQKIFHPRDVLDVQDFAFYWFESLPEITSISMDSLRKYFGIPLEGGHDALKDVRDEAWIIKKMLKLHRHLARKIPFKNAYTNEK